MNIENIKNAFVWLQHNGHEKEIENLLHNVKELVQLATDKNYMPEGREWEKRLEYACKQINRLDKAYFETHNEHFVRKYNRDSKSDMSRYIAQIAVAVVW